MAQILYESGNLLEFIEGLIVHQCNCLTVHAHGLAQTIARRFPMADLYAAREPIGKRNLAIEAHRGTPGTFLAVGRVVCFMAQWRPGKINSPYFGKYPESDPPETADQREKWFAECLAQLASTYKDPLEVAFPDHIGCGMAGGNWVQYERMIKEFAERLPLGSRVHIIKLESFW